MYAVFAGSKTVYLRSVYFKVVVLLHAGIIDIRAADRAEVFAVKLIKRRAEGKPVFYAFLSKLVADRAEYYYKLARDGEPYDVNTREPMKASTIILISLVVGLVVGYISVSAMKGQLKSVQPNNRASAYIVDGSMQLARQNDLFLYRNVARVAKPKDTGSSRSGGSSTHRSSSGRSHGGGGGKFSRPFGGGDAPAGQARAWRRSQGLV